MPGWTTTGVLSLLLTAAAMLWLPAHAAVPEKVPPRVPDVLVPLPPEDVRLGGHVGDAIERCVRQRLTTEDPEELVAPFRERRDRHEWKSEFWGKWITSAIAACRLTGDARLRAVVDRAAQGILATQSADGCIGSYPDGGRLQRWDTWGRKYTLLGLLAYHELTGDPEVLRAAARHADCLLNEIGPGKESPFKNDMWQGMASSSVLEPVVLLYRRTGERRYLEFAEYLVREWATPQGPDLLRKALDGIRVFAMFAGPKPDARGYGDAGKSKAYEMMSCYEGLAELYRTTGNGQYLDAVRNVYAGIRDTEITLAGSGSDWERWCDGRRRQTEKWHDGMETCVTVTWMKLAAQVLRVTGDPTVADEIERTLLNALLGAQKRDGSWWCHGIQLAGARGPAPVQHIGHNCCVANGPRGLMLAPSLAVMAGREGPVANLYGQMSATVTLASGRRVRVEQETDYPASGEVRLAIRPERPEAFTLSLRVPAWSARTRLSVNGKAEAAPPPATYARLKRTWRPGDVVTLSLDLRARRVPAPGAPGFAAVIRGPLVLVRDRRLDPGDVDAPVAIAGDAQGFVDAMPLPNPPEGVHLAFCVPVAAGSGRKPTITMCDFASAGNTWGEDSRYRVWLPAP